MYFNGQPVSTWSQDRSTGSYYWTDYIYANGQKIAKIDSQKPAFVFKGTRSQSSCSEDTWIGYLQSVAQQIGAIQAGDVLSVDMRMPESDTGTYAQGGLYLEINNQPLEISDSEGQAIDNSTVTDGKWHHRSFAVGNAVPGQYPTNAGIVMQSGTAVGDWEMDFANMTLTRADGSYIPIPIVELRAWDGTLLGGGPVDSECAATNLTATSATIPVDASEGTTYFLADQVGTTQMELSNGGWPLWQGWFTPFGQQIVNGTEQNVIGQVQQDGSTNRYRFTGKERDTETGLDYFGARYYASTMGRWMSPDPGKLNMKHLMNPQKWNKYAYVLNNPLSLVDPNGEEEMWIQYRAFIPQSNVAYAGRGDNRSFSTQENASSRVSVTMHIETDPAKNGGNPLLGFTTGINSTHNNVTGNDTPAVVLQAPTVTATQDANGNVNLNLQLNVRSGDVPDDKAGIRSNVNIGVNEAGTQGSVQGTVSGSPAFETNFAPQGGPTTNLPIQPAATNAAKFFYGLTQTNTVDKKTDIKQPGQQ